MGTVESLDAEICRWSGFAKALRKPDREAFDELMKNYRSYATEVCNANYPTTFEPMIICILLAQQVRIQKLERQLKEASQKDGENTYG
jgi:hypothetical protein